MDPHVPEPEQYDVDRYFALAEEGLVSPDERTELLNGVIVAMAPQSPLHAASLYRVQDVLRAAFPPGTVIRGQSPLVASRLSVPEPDLAVLAGNESDYFRRHPGTALLVVEIAVSTVAQDRLTKSRIYARAGVRNYWIVQPGEEWVEVYTDVRPELRVYASMTKFSRGDTIELRDVHAMPVRPVQVDDLFLPPEG